MVTLLHSGKWKEELPSLSPYRVVAHTRETRQLAVRPTCVHIMQSFLLLKDLWGKPFFCLIVDGVDSSTCTLVLVTFTIYTATLARQVVRPALFQRFHSKSFDDISNVLPLLSAPFTRKKKLPQWLITASSTNLKEQSGVRGVSPDDLCLLRRSTADKRSSYPLALPAAKAEALHGARWHCYSFVRTYSCFVISLWDCESTRDGGFLVVFCWSGQVDQLTACNQLSARAEENMDLCGAWFFCKHSLLQLSGGLLCLEVDNLRRWRWRVRWDLAKAKEWLGEFHWCCSDVTRQCWL